VQLRPVVRLPEQLWGKPEKAKEWQAKLPYKQPKEQ
jgi:hypothetical protein